MSDVKNWRETLKGNRSYTLADVQQIQEEAARLQAEVVSQHLAWIGSNVWRAVKWVAGGVFNFLDGVVQGVSAMRLYEELSTLSDDELAKIGVNRGNITRYVFAALATSTGSRGLYAIDGDLPAAETVLPSTEIPSRQAA